MKAGSVWFGVVLVAVRRVTLGGAICAAVGLTLLADVQARAGDVVVWSCLAAFTGAAILVAAVARRRELQDGGSAAGNGRTFSGTPVNGALS